MVTLQTGFICVLSEYHWTSEDSFHAILNCLLSQPDILYAIYCVGYQTMSFS